MRPIWKMISCHGHRELSIWALHGMSRTERTTMSVSSFVVVENRKDFVNSGVYSDDGVASARLQEFHAYAASV
jgi:hypothetical protein